MMTEVGRRVSVAEQNGVLLCTLLDRRSSVPLAGAQINCVWRDSRVSWLEADKRGNFSAELPQGVYDLVISARGYLSLLVRGVGVLAGYRQVLTRGLIPGEGQSPSGEPATAIGGYVMDRIGRPVGNATMLLSSEDGKQSYTTITDRSGAYVLHGVVPNMYDLVIRAGERTVLKDHVPIAHVKNFVRLDPTLIQL